MNVFTRSKNIIKTGVIGGSAAAVLVASPLAFAHGSSGGSHDGDRGSRSSSSRQVASSTQQHQKQDSDRNSQRQNEWRKHRAERQKTCAEWQASVNAKATATLQKDQKKLNGLNIILSGTQTYVASGVTVENYDALNGAATADQATATGAVNAVVAPQLNCDDDSADSANKAAVEDFYNKVKAADQSLATYRHDVMKLFDAAINS